MDSKNTFKNEKEKIKLINTKNKLQKIRCDYFLQKFFNIITKKISLEIIKYNKDIQKRLNININNYKEYSELYSSIEIEIIPIKNNYGKIISNKI